VGYHGIYRFIFYTILNCKIIILLYEQIFGILFFFGLLLQNNRLPAADLAAFYRKIIFHA